MHSHTIAHPTERMMRISKYDTIKSVQAKIDLDDRQRRGSKDRFKAELLWINIVLFAANGTKVTPEALVCKANKAMGRSVFGGGALWQEVSAIFEAIGLVWPFDIIGEDKPRANAHREGCRSLRTQYYKSQSSDNDFEHGTWLAGPLRLPGEDPAIQLFHCGLPDSRGLTGCDDLQWSARVLVRTTGPWKGACFIMKEHNKVVKEKTATVVKAVAELQGIHAEPATPRWVQAAEVLREVHEANMFEDIGILILKLWVARRGKPLKAITPSPTSLPRPFKKKGRSHLQRRLRRMVRKAKSTSLSPMFSPISLPRPL